MCKTAIVMCCLGLVLTTGTIAPAEGGVCVDAYSGLTTSGKIFGPPYYVPELNFKFVHAEDNTPIIPKQIIVKYIWEWLKYPYPEHAFGAWTTEWENVECTATNSLVVVPERTVRPRGSYDGTYTKFPFTLLGNRKPHFSQLAILIHLQTCTLPQVVIEKDDLPKYRDATASLAVACGQLPEITFTQERK